MIRDGARRGCHDQVDGNRARGRAGTSRHRLETNEARLAAWERRTRPLIIAAALIPLIGVSTGTTDFGLVGNLIEVACWVVFLVDLIVHMRLHPHYLGTGFGKFDLTVVVLTSPWYLLPGCLGRSGRHRAAARPAGPGCDDRAEVVDRQADRRAVGQARVVHAGSCSWSPPRS